MNVKDLAIRLAALTVIEDAVKAEKEAARAAILEALDLVGADSARAELPDGTRVAKVSVIVPKPSAKVTDEDALASHVAAEYPTEVVTRVRESFRKHLLDRLVPGPDGSAVDPDTGELVPGVRFTDRTPYPSTRFDSGGRDAVAAAFRAGLLPLDLTPATPALEA